MFAQSNFTCISGDQYGCEYDVSQGKQTCGFGKGYIQNEYFACADIAIVAKDRVSQIVPEEENVNSANTNDTSVYSRQKRTIHHSGGFQSKNQGVPIPYLAFPGSHSTNGMVSVREPQYPGPPQNVWQWLGSSQVVTQPERFNVGIRNTDNRQNVINGNFIFGSGRSERVGNRVRLGFNRRNNGEALPPALTIEQQNIETPQRSAFISVNKPIKQLINASPNMQPIQNGHMINNIEELFPPQPILQTPQPTTKRPSTMRHVQETRIQRNFIDPFAPGKKVAVHHTLTQTVLATRYTPTKKCDHCPFDHCLDDKMNIDGLFPGLFESPNQFFKCKRYEKLFVIGNYDVIQEGIPDCRHPRFRRQLSSQVDDDDIGCCAT